MRRVYTAQDYAEAFILKGLLEENGISAHVSGQYLQGGIGELPVSDLFILSVAEEDEARARVLLRDYEAGARP